jgi:hypothetical protein
LWLHLRRRWRRILRVKPGATRRRQQVYIVRIVVDVGSLRLRLVDPHGPVRHPRFLGEKRPGVVIAEVNETDGHKRQRSP